MQQKRESLKEPHWAVEEKKKEPYSSSFHECCAE